MCSSQLLLLRQIVVARYILQPRWSCHVDSHCTCRSRGTEMAVACHWHPMFAQTRDREPRSPFYTGKVICPKSRSKVGSQQGTRTGWIAMCLLVLGSRHQTASSNKRPYLEESRFEAGAFYKGFRSNSGTTRSKVHSHIHFLVNVPVSETTPVITASRQEGKVRGKPPIQEISLGT